MVEAAQAGAYDMQSGQGGAEPRSSSVPKSLTSENTTGYSSLINNLAVERNAQLLKEEPRIFVLIGGGVDRDV
jgi:hypothetical protein